jgi:hypothetical protein
VLVPTTVTPPDGTLAGAKAHQQSVDEAAAPSPMNFTVRWRSNGSGNPLAPGSVAVVGLGSIREPLTPRTPAAR